MPATPHIYLLKKGQGLGVTRWYVCNNFIVRILSFSVRNKKKKRKPDKGNNHFQPININWSYLNLGKLARINKNTKTIKIVFTTKKNEPDKPKRS